MITAQATPRCLNNEHTIVLFLGQTPSKKANRNSPGFWASESETSKIMLTMLEKFLQWEVALTSNQENGVADMIDQGFLPFLNLYAWGKPGKEGFKPATDLLISRIPASSATANHRLFGPRGILSYL